MGNKSDNNLIGDILRIVIVTAFFIAASLLIEKCGVRQCLLDMPSMRTILGSAETGGGIPVSWLVFVAAGSVLIAAGVPRLLASTVAGVIYGAFMGSILSLAASLLGSSLLYLGGRFILGHVVERRLSGRLNKWRARFRENAFWWVLYGRLFPFSNSTLMSLLCGSCNVPFLPYVLGSIIGFVPLAVVFACYGSGGMNGNLAQIAIATGLLILSFTSRRIFGLFFPRHRADAI